MSSTAKFCYVPTCQHVVGDGKLFCKYHWNKIPPAEQAALFRAQEAERASLRLVERPPLEDYDPEQRRNILAIFAEAQEMVDTAADQSLMRARRTNRWIFGAVGLGLSVEERTDHWRTWYARLSDEDRRDRTSRASLAARLWRESHTPLVQYHAEKDKEKAMRRSILSGQRLAVLLSVEEDGLSLRQAAKIHGVDRKTVRKWVIAHRQGDVTIDAVRSWDRSNDRCILLTEREKLVARIAEIDDALLSAPMAACAYGDGGAR